MLALEVPLFSVMARMSVVAPVPPKVLLAAPVNVMPAPAVSPAVLKSSVPLFVRSPPTERICVPTVPVEAVWNMPPLSIVTLAPAVSVLAVGVFVLQVAAVLDGQIESRRRRSIVTVQPGGS